MKKSSKLGIGMLAVAAILYASLGVASAALIADFVYVEKDMGGGLWQYEYTIFNNADPVADAGADLYLISFDFDSSAIFSLIDLPDDWDIIDGSGFGMTFSISPGAFPIGADVAPGTSLGGFVFQFNQRVGNLAFQVLFNNTEDPSEPFIYEGTSRGASASVPEPTTAVLLAVALLGLAGLRDGRIRERLQIKA